MTCLSKKSSKIGHERTVILGIVGEEECRWWLHDSKAVWDNVKWQPGDIITVKVDLKEANISFYLNNVKIAETMKIERNWKYHFCVQASAESQYELLP